MKKNSIRTRAKLNNISLNTVYSRIKRGWDKERALSTPVPERGRMCESRDIAIALGSRIFIAKTPCHTCGDFRRYVKNYTCIVCQLAANKRFQEKLKNRQS